MLPPAETFLLNLVLSIEKASNAALGCSASAILDSPFILCICPPNPKDVPSNILSPNKYVLHLSFNGLT